jgi:hypothetical protein
MAKKRIAALAWPYLYKAAFALVIQVEWDAQDQNSLYKARVIEEIEEMSLPDMFRRCRQLQEKYDIELWHGDAMNEPMISLMIQSGGVIPLALAPYIDKPDAVTLYLQTIRELTRADKKVLSFGEHSGLSGALTNLPKDKPISISEYPPVAALGYVASALYLWLQLEYEKKPKTPAQRIIEHCESIESDWDSGLLGYGADDDAANGDLSGFWPD